MVVVLMGGAGTARTAVGRAVAGALGWPFVDANDPHALHAVVDVVLGRREHLVAATHPLRERDQRVVRGELRHVRFVALPDHGADPATILDIMRHEFGL